MPRSFWLITLLVALASASWATPVRADTKFDPDQIGAALRAGTPSEQNWIKAVVTMVNNGQIPADLFESTFLWARKKTKHQFQYFQHGLIARAADAGITIQWKYDPPAQ